MDPPSLRVCQLDGGRGNYLGNLEWAQQLSVQLFGRSLRLDVPGIKHHQLSFFEVRGFQPLPVSILLHPCLGLFESSTRFLVDYSHPMRHDQARWIPYCFVWRVVGKRVITKVSI